MLCSRLGDTWQIGTASIREDQQVATGLRFVHWCHASENVDAQKDPKNNPTVLVYQHLEDELHRAGAGSEAILALTTTRDGATNLRNYFEITGKQANAETAVKVAGAAAKHCIASTSTFLIVASVLTSARVPVLRVPTNSAAQLDFVDLNS